MGMRFLTKKEQRLAPNIIWGIGTGLFVGAGFALLAVIAYVARDAQEPGDPRTFVHALVGYALMGVLGGAIFGKEWPAISAVGAQSNVARLGKPRHLSTRRWCCFDRLFSKERRGGIVRCRRVGRGRVQGCVVQMTLRALTTMFG